MATAKKIFGVILIVISIVIAIPSVMNIEYSFYDTHSIVGTIASLLGSLLIPGIPFFIGVILIKNAGDNDASSGKS